MREKGAAAEDDALHDSPFMRACRREPVPYTPVWLMRQAGRYMREYREVRDRVNFLELCKTPDLAAEVTLTAVERLNVDAAIIFADILLIIEPMGIELEFGKGEGPVILNPVRGAHDVERLREVESVESLDFVMEAIRRTRRALRPNIPLIGFGGAPFTLASYIIEGGGSRNYVHTKTLMYADSGAWHSMMSLIARGLAKYLNAQVEAGAQAVQLFDSWVGCLSTDDYREYVLPHTREVIESIKPGTPIIAFILTSSVHYGITRDGVDETKSRDVVDFNATGDFEITPNIRAAFGGGYLRRFHVVIYSRQSSVPHQL